ncbi:hypothetical protein LSAT2_000732 [Lamellibrachia satsuma]|nr:hypothetical protein LSAT2_000732 [Lamellibrachia satsuma]
MHAVVLTCATDIRGYCAIIHCIPAANIFDESLVIFRGATFTARTHEASPYLQTRLLGSSRSHRLRRLPNDQRDGAHLTDTHTHSCSARRCVTATSRRYVAADAAQRKVMLEPRDRVAILHTPLH